MRNTDNNGALAWIEPGRRFTFEDIVFWRGKEHQSFLRAAGKIDTIVLAPHATAAFPAELAPFVSPTLTRRQQFDYSDVTTSALGRAWAAADEHTVFIENPHPRLVCDANRPPPVSIGSDLREFYQRLRAAEGARASFTGIDTVRPITFAGMPVLTEPTDEWEMDRLVETLEACALNGATVYDQMRGHVLNLVLAARNERPPLLVISLHDTDTYKMRDDGAITAKRSESDRMPFFINFGNRGDEHGDAVGGDHTSLSGASFQSLIGGWREAFCGTGASRADKRITLNKPYKGAYETMYFGARLRTFQDMRIGALQIEFNRELLLGPASAKLREPGVDWPDLHAPTIDEVVAKCVAAMSHWRQL